MENVKMRDDMDYPSRLVEMTKLTRLWCHSAEGGLACTDRGICCCRSESQAGRVLEPTPSTRRAGAV